jgi:diacylglycerol kinase (CTP)
MTAIARYEFSSASLLMHSMMDQLDADLELLSRTSAEKYQQMRERLMQTWQDWPRIKADFEQALQNLPRELRRRDCVMSALQELEDFEANAKASFAELTVSSLETFRATVSPRLESMSARLVRMRAEASAFSERLSDLHEHPLIEKFLRGEPILASRAKIQWQRKFGHMALGMIFLYLFEFSGVAPVLLWSIYGVFFLAGFTLEISRHLSPKINDWVCVAFGPVMREREKKKINSGIFYMASMSIVFFLFPRDIAILTMLFIALGDPVAGIIGTQFGKHKISQHASLEGTLACFGLCAVLSFIAAGWIFTTYALSGWLLIVFALLGGLTGAVAEGSLKMLDDNLVMPLVSAPLLWLLATLLS